MKQLSTNKWTSKDFLRKDMKWWDPDENDPFMLDQIKVLKNILGETVPNLVEIGIGRGRITSLLMEYAEQLFGLEINFEAIRLTQHRVPKATLIQGDAQELPFRNESIDRIVCWETFMHLSSPELFFQESYRVLKHEGRLIFNFLRSGSRGHRRFLLRRIKHAVICNDWLPHYHFDNLKHVIDTSESFGFRRTHLFMEATSVPILSFRKD